MHVCSPWVKEKIKINTVAHYKGKTSYQYEREGVCVAKGKLQLGYNV